MIAGKASGLPNFLLPARGHAAKSHTPHLDQQPLFHNIKLKYSSFLVPLQRAHLFSPTESTLKNLQGLAAVHYKPLPAVSLTIMSCILAAQSCAYASLSNAALVKDACVRGFGAKPAPSRGCALKAKTPMQANSQRIGGICHAASAHGVSLLVALFWIFLLVAAFSRSSLLYISELGLD